MSCRTLVLLVLCTILTGAMVLALDAQERPVQADPPRESRSRSDAPVIRATAVSPGQPAQSRRSPGPPASSASSQPTRLQIDVFELACTSEMLAALHLDSITAKNPVPSEMLIRLVKMGKARLLLRADSTMDLAVSSVLMQNQKVPVVREVAVDKEGKAAQSVSYENIGLTTDIRGRWREDKPDRADLSFKLELSSIAVGTVETAPGVKPPVLANLSTSGSLMAVSGVPVWTMASSLPLDDDQATITVTFVRVTVTRLEQ
ncbi:MAG TPA: hypothetical protein PKY77_24205 [Phycisphaerae bacterium]|nr:hypothetical protein [Phycisphaerae bacterium]HRY71383.1 hypothetical protein [Phycisphaerae bacterium]HSA29859.1 hypothetical protein [Phycisphaerae bacterium]